MAVSDPIFNGVSLLVIAICQFTAHGNATRSMSTRPMSKFGRLLLIDAAPQCDSVVLIISCWLQQDITGIILVCCSKTVLRLTFYHIWISKQHCPLKLTKEGRTKCQYYRRHFQYTSKLSDLTFILPFFKKYL